jgi:choline kinase
MMRFQGSGVNAFRNALNANIRKPSALKAWYLSVVNEMAATMPVRTVSITGLWWGEIDSPSDLEQVRSALEGGTAVRERRVVAPLRAGGFAG